MKLVHVLFLLLIVAAVSAGAQGLTAEQIVNKVNDLMNQESSQANMIMTIITSSGQERTFEYLSYSRDKGEKNLMIYLSPRHLKGQKTLMLNNADDIWAYFARTKRVRKLASHAKKQKWEGSDFSYEDMGASSAFVTDFDAKRLSDEEKSGYDCYTIELTKKPEVNSSYAKLIMWVIKENFLPIVIDYYAEENPESVEKRLIQSDIRIIDGVPTGMNMVMTNLNDGTSTKLALKEVRYNIRLQDELFTERGLRK